MVKKKVTRIRRSPKEIKAILAACKKLSYGEAGAFYKKNGISSAHVCVWAKRFGVKMYALKRKAA